MLFAGVDIGSRSTEIVLIDETASIVHRIAMPTSTHPKADVERVLAIHSPVRTTSTGYGRALVSSNAITEIKAYAIGIHALHPDIDTILDIGGQDTKAILLNADGHVVHFEMNDRCAAGTGKFLEIMASTLSTALDQFGPLALQAKNKNLQIGHMCAVFAESEVISLLTRGEEANAIAWAVHRSVATKSSAMLRKILTPHSRIAFAGGVAQNPCMIELISNHIERPLLVPKHPAFVGAFGASWHALHHS